MQYIPACRQVGSSASVAENPMLSVALLSEIVQFGFFVFFILIAGKISFAIIVNV